MTLVPKLYPQPWPLWKIKMIVLWKPLMRRLTMLLWPQLKEHLTWRYLLIMELGPRMMLPLQRPTSKWGQNRSSRGDLTIVPDQVIRPLPDQVIGKCSLDNLDIILIHDQVGRPDAQVTLEIVREHLIMYYLTTVRTTTTTTTTWLTIHRPDGSAAGKKMGRPSGKSSGGAYCAALNCKNCTKRDLKRGVKFYRFPKHEHSLLCLFLIETMWQYQLWEGRRRKH